MVQLKVSCKKRHKLEVCRKLLFSEPSTFLQLGVCSNTKTSLSTVSNDHFEKTGGGISRRNSGALQSTSPGGGNQFGRWLFSELNLVACHEKGGGEAAEGWALQATPPRRKPIQGMTVFTEHNVKPIVACPEKRSHLKCASCEPFHKAAGSPQTHKVNPTCLPWKWGLA